MNSSSSGETCIPPPRLSNVDITVTTSMLEIVKMNIGDKLYVNQESSVFFRGWHIAVCVYAIKIYRVLLTLWWNYFTDYTSPCVGGRRDIQLRIVLASCESDIKSPQFEIFGPYNHHCISPFKNLWCSEESSWFYERRIRGQNISAFI